jgi:carbon storage regulator CsrA
VLIVGREIGQSVIIGEVIKVTVLQFGSKLRLAIDAPEHIRITRDKENQTPSSYKKRVKKVVDSIRIGNSVKVTVLQTETGLLRFAIDAPKEISIYREELCENQPPTGNQNVIMI